MNKGHPADYIYKICAQKLKLVACGNKNKIHWQEKRKTVLFSCGGINYNIISISLGKGLVATYCVQALWFLWMCAIMPPPAHLFPLACSFTQQALGSSDWESMVIIEV